MQAAARAAVQELARGAGTGNEVRVRARPFTRLHVCVAPVFLYTVLAFPHPL